MNTRHPRDGNTVHLCRSPGTSGQVMGPSLSQLATDDQALYCCWKSSLCWNLDWALKPLAILCLQIMQMWAQPMLQHLTMVPWGMDQLVWSPVGRQWYERPHLLTIPPQYRVHCSTWGWVGLWGFLWWAPPAKRKDHHRVSSGWSSVWRHSNTGLSGTQYEQIPIILGVWPFWLTPYFFFGQ